jgi:hypothetical protein
MKCGKNQTQAKQLVAAKVWLGKLWLGTKQAPNFLAHTLWLPYFTKLWLGKLWLGTKQALNLY